MGKNGSRRALVNSRGKEVGRLDETPAEPGKQLKLTVDVDLQIAAEQALGDKNGAVVAMDPRTGEILAMVSRPTFDPNDFAVRIKRDEWNKLVNDRRPSAAEQSDSGATRARLDLQDHHGHRRAAGRHRPGHARDTATAAPASMAAISSAGWWPNIARTASSTSARPFTSPATFSSTRWPRSWASTASPNTPPRSGSGRRRASTCRRKSPASCRRKSGRSATSSRSGLRAKPSRLASARAPWRPRRFRWRVRSAPSPAGGCWFAPHVVNPTDFPPNVVPAGTTSGANAYSHRPQELGDHHRRDGERA